MPNLTTDPDVQPGPAEPRPAQRERVVEILRGLTSVIRHHKAPVDVVNSMNQQLSDYLDVQDESLFLKRAKYVLTAPMARYLNNDKPSVPDCDFVPKGAWLRWSKARLRVFRTRNTHLWYSFLQAKRSAAVVSKDIVLENLQKHRKQMQASDPLDGEENEELLDELMRVLEPVLKPLRDDLTKELAEFFEHPEDERHQASLRASLESTRKTGGQAGFLRERVRGVQVLDGGDLMGLRERRGPHLKDKEIVFESLQETRGREVEGAALADLIRTAIREAGSGVPRYEARVEAVLEPLKVRTISKGPSVPYYIAKRVQLVLHGLMRKMEPFRLIGTPFCPSFLMDIYRSFESEWIRDFEDVNWLSVDYSAATDGLSARLSAEILESLLSKLAPRNLGLYYLLRGVLAPHRISYPPVKTSNGLVQLEDVDQKNGQLMGSILSFPILCLANLGLYLLVKTRNNPGASVRKLARAVLVNGDDMLYIGSHKDWELHKALGRRIGLEMSPGKAYIHPKYANINSVSVQFDLTHAKSKIPSHPQKVGYLNTGLLVGKHKVQGKFASDDPEAQHPMSAVVNEILDGCYDSEGQNTVLKQYLHVHKSELARETKGRNLFLPISVGGMGVRAPKGWKLFVTKQQREWAGGILKRAEFKLNGIESNWLVPAERPLPCGLPLFPKDDRLVDPVRPGPEASRAEKLPKGSQKGLRRALVHGLTPYFLYPDLGSNDDNLVQVGVPDDDNPVVGPKTFADLCPDQTLDMSLIGCKDLRAKQNAERLHGVPGGVHAAPLLEE